VVADQVRRSLSGAPIRDTLRSMLKFLHALFLTDSHARLRLWTAYLLFLATVIIGSIPGARAQAAQLAEGVVLHSCGYSLLTFLLFTGHAGNAAQRAVKAVLVIAVMGAIDEFVQTFFPYRHGSIQDWEVDMVAAVVAATVLWALWSKRKVTAA
jgi:VanZ family protein